MHRYIPRAVILSLAVAAFVAASGGQALASEVRCGDTITRDTSLKKDLVNCPNNGIVIGADNITLDLGGHTIDGDGEFVPDCAPDQPCDVGVVNDRHKSVTIKGGSIREFGLGVSVVGGDHHRLRGLSLSSNLDFGVVLGSSTGSRIGKNSFVDNGVSGLVVFDSNSTRIERNSVSGSTGFAIFLSAVNESGIMDNTIDGNEHGIAVFDESSRNTVRGNSVSRGGGSAIDIGGPANRAVDNRLTDNGDGIVVADFHDNLISRNTVTGTGQLTDPEESGGFGIILDGADRSTLDRNIVTGGRGPAIFVTSLEAPTVSHHNIVTRNVANSTLSDGILVNENATATLLERNTANRSGDDGIDIDAAGTKLTRNTATRNHDLGIEAVPGTTDGGGNRASGNGNPLQCVNVFCR